MKFELKNKIVIRAVLCITFMLLLTGQAYSQLHFSGRIISMRDGKPIAFATISIDKIKRKAIADMYGNFSLSVEDSRNNDSLSISSVGYRSLELPVQDAVLRKEFALYEEARELQPVILFSKEAAVGSGSEITGYFRAWNPHNTGGEIGRIFNVEHSRYKLERVRFKLNNRCDTCLIRLHIREVVDEEPGEEILNDSIATMVNRLAFDDKFSEFDLRPYDFVFKNNTVFVGLEVLNCSKRNNESCSICFIGTEQGHYLYKSYKNSVWEQSSDYSIFLKIFYKY